MTIIIGLTGGIASGKTTIIKYLKKKKVAIHSSDTIVQKMYSRPSLGFLRHLKNINLKNTIKGKTINKEAIREEIFNNDKKRKQLEKYIHREIKKSRDFFLNNNKLKKTKIVFLDIPLLFENKLEKICNYTILLYSPLKTRKQRALKRKGMKKPILEKIIKSQLSDKVKKERADFVVNSSKRKKNSYNEIEKIINLVINNQ